MEQRQLGGSGLWVSRIALGTMTWGRDTGEDDAAQQLIAFVESGGTLVDTADVYADGDSERMLGRLLGVAARRSDVIIATKSGRAGGARNPDASRRHLLSALDASLRRLGVDEVDLWQLHGHDPRTPMEETLAAVDTAVSSGRVRYAGLCDHNAWQLAKAAAWQRAGAQAGRAPVVSSQMEYSLLNRSVEGDLLEAAADAGVSLLAWSPLGRGVLTGKYRSGIPADSRAASGHLAPFVQPYLDERSRRIVESVHTAADGLGVAPLAVALSWVRDRPGVAAPVVGARTAEQLEEILDAESVTLPYAIRTALDDVSAGHDLDEDG
ncbi:aldo/keto reductase [Allonocardiopsis opalescens]|uniref:Aryl-alcohol dehydrogenase-like predicted oxidoreductase n=1 Tax=Allonocardiopsis opalescens TaxID=1144618 RepID=A0A2T0Q494_9ACTN|nr:aldo/keto reductase [Allonocardiopsis opalescens]PRX98626.1 aryl-alcohol dehydrogenase-like predicted oxidoreductase [Allonocardiopsis opalescens]